MTMINRNSITAWLVFLLLAAGVPAQSGGTFTITQSVVAGGGVQNAAAGTYSLGGTAGQAVAGNAMRTSSFAVTSGFWNFTALTPTAASVSVGGRVRTADGRGIQNAEITIMSPNGSTQLARSSSFGYYRFEGVAVGETYVVSIAAKWFTFGQPAVVVGVVDEITDLDFVAE